MAEQIRAYPWDATALGPVEEWSASLRFAVDTMLSCSFPAVLLWGPELVLFYNDAYVPLLGQPHAEALGRRALYVFPEIVESYHSLTERVKRGERVVLADQFFPQTSGEPKERWFDFSCSPVYDEKGHVAGTFAIGQETTTRLLAERANEKADNRLRRVLETDAVGVIFFDYSGTIIDTNDVFLKMVGYSREEIAAGTVTWRTLTAPEWVKASEEQMENLANTGRMGPYEKEFIVKDGTRRWMLFAGRDLGDGTVVEYAIDITSEKQSEAVLLRNEKLATLGRLAASIAHEINNPLESTTNLLYLAQSVEGLPPDSKHYIDLAELELRRIAHITRRALGFYRESSLPMDASLTELLEESIDLLRGKIASKSVHIHRHWNGEDFRIKAVPGELRQVFSNLLANSVDAVEPEGEIAIRVSKRYGDKPHVRVTFADSGCGIEPGHQETVFDPFYSTKGNLGTGLGLWITRRIVDKHSGSIRLRSRSVPPNRGTVFSLTFPM